jgi:hypothetical protein
MHGGRIIYLYLEHFHLGGKDPHVAIMVYQLLNVSDHSRWRNAYILFDGSDQFGKFDVYFKPKISIGKKI